MRLLVRDLLVIEKCASFHFPHPVKIILSSWIIPTHEETICIHHAFALFAFLARPRKQYTDTFCIQIFAKCHCSRPPVKFFGFLTRQTSHQSSPPWVRYLSARGRGSGLEKPHFVSQLPERPSVRQLFMNLSSLNGTWIEKLTSPQIVFINRAKLRFSADPLPIVANG